MDINKTTNKHITRFEIIDHRENTREYGRIISIKDNSMELIASYQDDDKTLKIFINNIKK